MAAHALNGLVGSADHIGGTVQKTKVVADDIPDYAEYQDEMAKANSGQKKIDQMMAFLLHVVRDEDYATGKRIQQNVKTGARSEFLFGRNEGGGQRFHRWVEALIHADDAELPELLRSGPA